MRRRASLSLIAACGLLLSACGEEDPAPGAQMDASHVHAIAVDPEDPDRLYVATHEGLGAWTEEGLVRVSRSTGDFMGFAVGPAGVLYGSGHPGRGEDAPFALGLISSEDGGRTWDPVSLSGEADFHALEYRHDRVYALNSMTGALMVSDDLRSWETRFTGPIADIAVSPEDPDTIVATTEAITKGAKRFIEKFPTNTKAAKSAPAIGAL